MTGSHDVDQDWMRRTQTDAKIVPRVIYERQTWDEAHVSDVVDTIIDEVVKHQFDGITLEVWLWEIAIRRSLVICIDSITCACSEFHHIAWRIS